MNSVFGAVAGWKLIVGRRVLSVLGDVIVSRRHREGTLEFLTRLLALLRGHSRLHEPVQTEDDSCEDH